MHFFTQSLGRSCSSHTIFALSSGQGKCGVAVIRVSGAHAADALKLVLNSETLPKPRTAVLKHIKHPIRKETLDKGLILWLPGPRSFTGEDSFELQVHGGIAVVNQSLVLPIYYKQKQKFRGNRLFYKPEGSLSKLYNKWKQILTNSVAHIEAHIDFEETETLEHNIIEKVTYDIKNLAKEINEHLIDGRKGEILRNGVRTVILGEPNAGKSSLLNLLCQRPAAIVTPIEGTTRDVLEVTLNIGGYPLVLADTAGLTSNTKDIVEKEGIQRALQLYEKSDLIVLVIDSEKYVKWMEENGRKDFDGYVKYYVKKMKIPNLIATDNSSNLFSKHCLIVVNKIDLRSNVELEVDEEKCVRISCKTEDGVSNLIERLSDRLKILCGEPSVEHPSMNQMRHRQHLTECLNCLQLFMKEEKSRDLVLMAEYLRKSLRHLGKLVGNITSEQLLDVIFRDFCIR
ncbi:hypothetical protein JTB14_032499 [Gonioctena quinquepunctata]|nr:hypothetical protein JTB14_032499 [Gonioctena quinquepunctata]